MAETIEKPIPEESDSHEPTENQARKRKPVAIFGAQLPWAVAVCSIVILAAALFCWQMSVGTTQLDAGATVSTYEGMTREEIQAELNKIARENRMVVSVSSRISMQENGVLRVNVVNDESNRFSQRFALIQDGSTIYESGAIEPGKAVEFCHASKAKEGKAALEIQAVDSDTLVDQGNPTRVSVDIVRETK